MKRHTLVATEDWWSWNQDKRNYPKLSTERKKDWSKPTMRYHFTSIRMAIFKKEKKNQIITSTGKDMGKLESPYAAGGDVKWRRHCEWQSGLSLKS